MSDFHIFNFQLPDAQRQSVIFDIHISESIVCADMVYTVERIKIMSDGSFGIEIGITNNGKSAFSFTHNLTWGIIITPENIPLQQLGKDNKFIISNNMGYFAGIIKPGEKIKSTRTFYTYPLVSGIYKFFINPPIGLGREDRDLIKNWRFIIEFGYDVKSGEIY